MPRSHRALLIVTLLVSLASLALHALRPTAAWADPAGPADLGPADALLLSDANPARGGAKELRVKADRGRIAWSDRDTARAWSIGAVHVDRAMKSILAKSGYQSRRDELDGEARTQDEDFAKRFEELRQRYANVDPQSPNWAEANESLERLRSEYMTWRDGSMRIREKFFAEQIEEGYRELVAAVEIVAERREVDIVIRFMPTGDPFEADTLMTAREQVLGRTFLEYPDAIDLTADVLRELGIND